MSIPSTKSCEGAKKATAHDHLVIEKVGPRVLRGVIIMGMADKIPTLPALGTRGATDPDEVRVSASNPP